MSKQGYPESLNCWLRDYPRFIKVIFGSEMGNLDGPWGDGSIILLEKESIDVPDTSPVTDEVPPDIKVTYTDTGTDVDWIFKIAMYGWGTFFATTEGLNYYVDLEKLLEFESIYFDLKKFRYRSVVETQIAKTESIPEVNIPEEIIYNPPDGNPPPSPPPDQQVPVTDYWGAVARTLVNYYNKPPKNIFNVNSINSISVSATKTSNLSPVGRQVGPTTTCSGNQLVEFWVFGNQLKILISSITYTCEDFNLGEPMDCTYSSYVSDAYFWNNLILNGSNRLPEFLRRV
jgi:hypothetical protein